MKKKADNKRRAIGLISWLVILSALLACNLPFSIQSADVYMATAIVKTMDAQATQEQNEVLPPSPTNIPAPNPTLTPTPTPQLFGTDKKFIIQRVQKGDTLSQYAEQYNTTEGAIIRVNYSLALPLWEDIMVVIPVGFSNVAQIPYFQPFMVTVGGLTVEDLARELATSLDALKYYNGLYDGKILNEGEWLIIPRMAPGY